MTGLSPSQDAATGSDRPGLGAGSAVGPAPLKVALLTGGADKPYALGMASTLASQGVSVEFIGSDQIDGPELHRSPLIRFLNLRGDQRRGASRWRKASRVFLYYIRLILYAAAAEPEIFHILWNNKWELFDRTLLMLYYRCLGRRIVFTAHNVNAGKRDGRDSLLNRLTLRMQYRLCGRIFVHTQKMKAELLDDFGVADERVTVIPFPVNNAVPRTGLTGPEARLQLGLKPGDKALLFFGNITPYKGLDQLIAAFDELARRDAAYTLIVAGPVKDCADYWSQVRRAIDASPGRERILLRAEYVADPDVELYFKAADVLILPYTHIFQSGVLFLGYGFGLPVIATDVGSLREEIVEGETGYVCRPQDPRDLARAVEKYFSSDLHRDLADRRVKIQAYANEHYSWAAVGDETRSAYRFVTGQGGS